MSGARREFSNIKREVQMNTTLRLGLAAAVIFMLGAAGIDGLNAQTASDRAKVLEALTRGDSAGAEKIVTELQAHLQAAPAVPGLAPAPASGSIFFEELKNCGFYPQETRLECVIEIKQQGGYGGALAAAGPITGTMEHVYFCVDWLGPAGVYTQYESVGQGSVNMYDGPAPANYAVYRDFNVFGGVRTRPAPGIPGAVMTATTAPVFTVKAILSWYYAPTGCNYVPVWGNILYFKVRMDPIR
jgi:hypothetical protein